MRVTATGVTPPGVYAPVPTTRLPAGQVAMTCFGEVLSVPLHLVTVSQPLKPGRPAEPCAPGSPLGPCAPASPCGPGSPFAPCGPESPFGPWGPAGSWPGLKSAASSVPSLTLRPVTAFCRIFGLVTALFLSCAAPTEFLARIRFPAAWPSGVEPNTATTSAVAAMMMAVLDLNIVLLLSSLGAVSRRGLTLTSWM